MSLYSVMCCTHIKFDQFEWVGLNIKSTVCDHYCVNIRQVFCIIIIHIISYTHMHLIGVYYNMLLSSIHWKLKLAHA